MIGGFTEIAYMSLHKSFAVEHVDLKHTESKKAFFSFHPDDLNNSLKDGSNQRVNDFVMLMEYPHGKLFDAGISHVIESVNGGFAILGKLQDTKLNDINHIQTVTNKCKSIGLDILMRLKALAVGMVPDESCNPLLSGFDMKTVNYEFVVYPGINYMGWLFTYSLNCSDAIKYDDSKWL